MGGRGWLVLGFAACACVFVSLCVCLLCGAVSRRVSPVVARYFLFVVHHKFVVDCLSLCCALLWLCCVGEERRRVYASNASPCVRAKRLLVYQHHADLYKTCGRGAGTHGDVLNVHTFFFF